MISEKYLVKLSELIEELKMSENPSDRMAASVLLVMRAANNEGALPGLCDAAVAFAHDALERIAKNGGAE